MKKHNALLIFLLLQACSKDLSESDNTKKSGGHGASSYGKCVKNSGIYCYIPLEAAFVNENIGLSVRLKGVLIAVEEYWNEILPKRRFKLYSSLSSAEVCGESLEIIPSNDSVYNFLLENDGKIIEVFGEIGGSQNPYIRYIEVDRIPLYALKAERLTDCGKIPPAPSPPPAPGNVNNGHTAH